MRALHQRWSRMCAAGRAWYDSARGDDRGSIITEYPALAAVVVTGALAIGALIVAVATGHANAIPGAGG